LYRVRQFWRTIFLITDHIDLDQARAYLNSAQWSLFSQLQPAEQDHALRMLRNLVDQGENQPDLLVAALLHDVGKLKYPLNPIERAVVVLVRASLPKYARRWSQTPEDGWEASPKWRKPFILAEQHAEWGAKLARETGVSRLTEDLIRNHHDPQIAGGGEIANNLLHKLWMVDNE